MDVIHFQTEIGADNIIRVPEGCALPVGPVTVTIVPSTRETEVKVPGTWQWMQDLAKEVENSNPDLPDDMAANHDFYAHGKPRP
jgi:hypothetical protein